MQPFFGDLLTIGLRAEVQVFAGGPDLCYIAVLSEFPMSFRYVLGRYGDSHSIR